MERNALFLFDRAQTSCPAFVDQCSSPLKHGNATNVHCSLGLNKHCFGHNRILVLYAIDSVNAFAKVIPHIVMYCRPSKNFLSHMPYFLCMHKHCYQLAWIIMCILCISNSGGEKQKTHKKSFFCSALHVHVHVCTQEGHHIG